MRNIEERLLLKYMDQVEFLRFRDIALDAENEKRRLEVYIERLTQKANEALEEIERLFKNQDAVNNK